MLHEYKHAWNISARTCFYIFENLDRCMLLYRYKLSNIYIWQKFGINNPKRIDLEKLDGSNLFIFHLDIYKENTEELSVLLNYCLEKNIEVYIPIPYQILKFPSSTREGESHSHIDKIRQILEGYEVVKYDFTKLSYQHIQTLLSNNRADEIENAIIEATKPLIRDLKMRKLLN